MIRMLGKLSDFTYEPYSSTARVTFDIDPESVSEALQELLNSDEKLVVEVKKRRQRRSQDANGYFWALCSQIAEKLNLTKEEVYRHEIKQVGECQMLTLQNDDIEKAIKTFSDAWSLNGIGWFTETADLYGNTAVIIAYFGSSTYDIKQMSRLIDNVVEECKELGISTLTPSELALLKEDWKR